MAVFSSIAAAISAVATWTVTVGGVSIAVGSFLLQAAVSFGTSAVASALAGKDKGPDNFPIQGTLRAGGQVPRSFVIGPGGTGGSLTWHTEWGQEGSTPNFYYTQVIALADFPVSGLRRWFVDGQPVTLEDTGADPGLAAVEYRVGGLDYAWIKFYDGTQTEADPFLTDVVSARGSRRYSRSRIGVGVAYAVVTFAINNELFSGLPESFFELDGIRLYDVSKDSTAGGSGPHRWGDQSTWGGDGDALPAVQAYNLARGIYFKRSFLSGALDENGTVELDAGASKLSFEIVGGGGGGGAAASAGGATTVTLKDGSAVVRQWTAQGGAASAAASEIVYQPSGEVSALSPRGDGGRGVRGYKEKDLPPVSGEAGGSAGEYLSVKDFDISGLSDPSLEVSVGAGGSGNGSAGRAGGISYQADVAPSSVEPQWLYGMQGVTSARLPAAHWIAQIAKCRVQIESGSGMEPAYRSAGEIRVNSELGAAFEAVLTACSGRMSEMGGVYKIYVGAPDAPIAHIEDGDISSLAPQSFTPFLGLAETVNGITASYPSPDEVFALRSTPPLYSAEYEAEDGGRRLLANVQLSLVPFPAQAQRLVKGELEAARRARRHSFTLLPRFRLLEPGDTLTFTSVRNGFVGKLFRVDGIIDLPNADLIVDITEVDPADHGNWEPSTDYTDVTPAPIVPVVPVPQAVKGFDPVPMNVTDGTGAARRPGLLMQWDGSVEDVAGIKFQVRTAASGVVVARPQTRDFDEGSFLISGGILSAEAYEVRARYIPRSPRATLWTGWVTVAADAVELLPDEFGPEFWERLDVQASDAADNLFDNVAFALDQLAEVDIEGRVSETLEGIRRDGEVETVRDEVSKEVGDFKAEVAETYVTGASQTAAIAQVENKLSAEAGKLRSSITENHTAIVGPDGAISSLRRDLSADIEGVSADLSQKYTAIAGPEGAIASLKTELSSGIGDLEADLVQNYYTSADTDHAISAATVDLVSSVGDLTTNVSQVISSVDGVKGTYGLRINNNGVVTGFGLVSELIDGEATSTFTIQANKFIIASSSGTTTKSPFYVTDGQVFIKSAVIGEGTIGRAKITDEIESDNYTENSKGVPTAGIKLNFKTGEAKFAGLAISRPMVLASGSFTVSGTYHDGAAWSFINTGIRVGKQDVWQAQNVALVAVAAISSAATADGGFDPNNTFWTLTSVLQPGARWNGFPNNQPSAKWRKDPSNLVTPYWSSGTDQRVFMRVQLEAEGAYFVNPKINWTVFQVT